MSGTRLTLAKPDPVDVEIPAEVLARLAELQPKSYNKGRQWLPWEDKLLMDNYGKYTRHDLAKLLGTSEGTMINRYRALKGQRHENT